MNYLRLLCQLDVVTGANVFDREVTSHHNCVTSLPCIMLTLAQIH